MKTNLRPMLHSAMIAALYVLFTLVSHLFGLASGPIQLRLSEALTPLAFLIPAALPGLTLGCFLANLLTGCAPWDVVFGSLATLLGALGSRHLTFGRAWLSPLYPILSNALVVPFVLIYVYGAQETYWYFLATVTAGEVLSCGVLGYALLRFAMRYRHKLKI